MCCKKNQVLPIDRRRPVSREEQHVQTHDSSGRPESEEAQHIVQENDNREHRENRGSV